MLSYARATARTWAEIRVEDVVNNHQAALSELAPGVRHVSVLKANAYGMGAVGTAEILYADGERLFAVACVEEALELRRALPDDAYILVMGETMPAEVAVSVSNRIASTVFRLETARALSEEAVRQGVQVHVHCKVDTGLNRLGFGTAEAAEAVQAVLRMPNLVYDGLFSHLQRRSPEHDRLQAERLWQVDRQLREAGIATPMLHMLDSIGMWRYPQYQFNAVRDGAFALGHTKLDYQHPEKLRLALSFKTRIVRIHDVPAGECCGYDARPSDDEGHAGRHAVRGLCGRVSARDVRGGPGGNSRQARACAGRGMHGPDHGRHQRNSRSAGRRCGDIAGRFHRNS